MKIIVRKLENSEHNFFAYLSGMSGKATFFLYFEDNIYGAVCLHHFAEMLKAHFKTKHLKICIQEKGIVIKSTAVLSMLNQEDEKND